MRTDANLKIICDALQQNCGDKHAAARAAGMSPMFLERWLKDDKEAAAEVEEATRVGWYRLESEAIRRAVEGVEKDVYYKGFVVGQQTEYSDGLLTKLLEARNPAFKKGEQQAVFNGPTQINIMPRAANYDEWLDMKRATLDAPVEAPALPAPVEGEYVEVEPAPLTFEQMMGLA